MLLVGDRLSCTARYGVLSVCFADPGRTDRRRSAFWRAWLGLRCWSGVGLLVLAGCQLFVDDSDREVYRLIAERQAEALGANTEDTIDRETVPKPIGKEAYSHVPSAIDSRIPETFRKTTTQPAHLRDYELPPDTKLSEQSDEPTSQPAPLSINEQRAQADREGKMAMSLADGLRYAQVHSRVYQTRKEDLYLSALQLSLERFLWTPQFLAEVQTQYANFGEVRDFDQAMDVVSDVSVSQRLPYGGDVSARVINSLMHDLTNHVTTGETGAVILEANIPLLRGAGKVARESLYQAERDLIYAVRDFERFRREFLVSIASEYFDLIQLKQRVINQEKSYRQFYEAWRRAEALAREEFMTHLDAMRAKSDERSALNNVINLKTQYEFALDSFKIRLGIPATTRVELLEDESELELLAPVVSEEEAIEAALKYRLDLLTVRDQIDDARRGTKIAANNLLPDVNFRTTVRSETDPTRFNSLDIRGDRSTWRAFLDVEIPVNRKAEQTAYRSSLISLRRAERRYVDGAEQVRLDVRNALRQIQQASISVQIQERSIQENELRLEQARLRFLRGEITNRDVVDAINDLRRARDRLAAAEAGYRQAILEFRRDTGTLRVDENGKWVPIEGAVDSQTGNDYNE